MRASEKIESDSSFLRLYSSIVIDTLIEKEQRNELWENIYFIHSSPGGGKTSLLRIFQPNTLLTLLNHRSNKTYKDLFNSLKKIKVLTDDTIPLLGVFLTCARNYAVLEDIHAETSQKRRLFFALLNARIIMSTLRGILTLKKAQFPQDLKNITFTYSNEQNYFLDLQLPCTGDVLFEWARRIEEKVYEALDSFAPLSEIQPKGHSELFSIIVLSPDNLQYLNETACEKVLFMLDDAHKLSASQRKIIKEYLIEARSSASVWIAERLEALEPDENLPLGAFQGRDFKEINLEQFWRDNPKKFENILLNIADKRSKLSNEVQIDSFQDYIQTDLDENEFETNFLKSISDSKEYLMKISSITNRYDDWIAYANEIIGTPYEMSQKLKAIQIIIARDSNKSQLTFDFPLSVTDIKDKINSTINVTAELFVAKGYEIPYYYGIDKIVKLSSANIEQFINFAAGLFEEILSRNVVGEDLIIKARRQEEIIKKLTDEKWTEIGKIVPYSKSVIKFLIAFGEMAQKETYKDNAPYAPGVTGIGIKLNKTHSLIEDEPWITNPRFDLLRNVLSSCVAYNLIEIETDVSQGKKGDKWMVLYLNRWLCNKYNLPYTYGGWRPRTPEDLLRIIQ